ncbi:hypothetical protein GCM10009579_86780 [Streptomyces javensis]|uniref:Uncharacterized protein n=1 Tax=Streptomyces javensis TaxID=114698 RepID=A0ABN1XE52_9ACTN
MADEQQGGPGRGEEVGQQRPVESQRTGGVPAASADSDMREDRSPVTVAGPRRTRTGFLVPSPGAVIVTHRCDGAGTRGATGEGELYKPVDSVFSPQWRYY